VHQLGLVEFPRGLVHRSYLHTSVYVSIRQHTSAYVSIRQHIFARSYSPQKRETGKESLDRASIEPQYSNK
jgi:hypothetical protein